jgi:hypothetical protein
MRTVVELAEFVRAARAAGMTDSERDALVFSIAQDPETG